VIILKASAEINSQGSSHGPLAVEGHVETLPGQRDSRTAGQRRVGAALSAFVEIPGVRLHPGASAVSWSTRPDTRDLLNLKSCELQSPTADRLLADALGQLAPSDLWRYRPDD
jgi:hypothetical protein